MLNPVLIVGMVGSLLFLLLEILYAGDYSERMRFNLVAFVFGIVCITRISVRADIAKRTTFYVLLLGSTVYIAFLRFADTSGGTHAFGWLVTLVLMVIVWWSAHRLTRDCIHLDADAEIGNEGLLDAAGIRERRRAARKAPTEKWPTSRRVTAGCTATGAIASGAGRSEHPVSGSCTSRLPRCRCSDLGRCSFQPTRAATLLFFRSPVSIRGVRTGPSSHHRIHRSSALPASAPRRRMPGNMTGSWLTTGLVLIAVLLLVAAVLPRPVPEYP